MRRSTRAAVAHHEAGHAVLALKLGIDFSYVTVFPDGATLGLTAVKWRRYWGSTQGAILRQRHGVENQLVIAFAGGHAEALYRGRAARFDDGDVLQACSIADQSRPDLGPVAMSTYLRFVRAQSLELVKGHWDSIQSVADWLLRQGTLSRGEVARMCWKPLA